MTRLPLSAIVFDAGTQIRAAIDQSVVADYAEAMTNGAAFPPIVLFHDGNRHYLADGFHRFMAAQRNDWREIDADVRPGTKDDAVWYALGANRTNGKRLSDGDKRHAIRIAIQTWPERSGAMIATQVGCSPQYVLQIKSGMTTTCDRIVTRSGHVRMASPSAAEQARKDATALLQRGLSVDEVRKQVRIGRDTVLELRRSLGMVVEKTRASVQGRIERMREMAAQGHTSRQIASTLGVSEPGCRATCRREGIDVPADRSVGKSKRHDSNRIVDRIVSDAENLTEGVALIDFSVLHRDQIAGWLRSLTDSRDRLGALIRRLMKEQQRNGEAA